MKNYSIIELEQILVTNGIDQFIDKEISVNKGDYSINDVKLVIDHILDYIVTEKRELKHLETFGCGSWMIQFVVNGTYIELHELKSIHNNKNVYEFDLSNSIMFLKRQLELCTTHNVTPIIPLIGQKIAVSKEILEGSEINGVRYEAPSHMSGWYLTSNDYNGDVNTLSVIHLYHLLQKRPEIAGFLSLPYGYRFFLDNQGEEVWYDKEVV